MKHFCPEYHSTFSYFFMYTSIYKTLVTLQVHFAKFARVFLFNKKKIVKKEVSHSILWVGIKLEELYMCIMSGLSIYVEVGDQYSCFPL